MTQAERDFVRLVNRRVASMQPDIARAVRAMYQRLADEIGTERVVALINSGRIDDIINDETLERATIPVRQELRASLERGFRLTIPDIAELIRKPVSVVKPDMLLDVLNPRVTSTILQLESRTLDTLKVNVQQVVRETVAEGLARGEHPKAISRDLRASIGLSSQQSRFVRNAGDDLRTLDSRYFTRALRDKRYDARVRKAIESGTALSDADIELIEGAYRRKYTKYNAELNTRAAAMDTYRLAQWEAYASSIDRGIIAAEDAIKEWIHFEPREHPRLDHKSWHGTIVGFYEVFPDGQQVAGLGYYNCWCQTRYGIRKRAIFPLPAVA